MGFTAEGARAELERRRQLKAPGFTPEGARAELERRRKSKLEKAVNGPDQELENLKRNHPYIHKAAEFLAKNPTLGAITESTANFLSPIKNVVEASHLPEIGGGIEQGLINTGISIANLPLEYVGKAFNKDLRIPHHDNERYLNPEQSNMAFR